MTIDIGDGVHRNALKYSMECFESLIESEWTAEMEITVFFNKYDVFWDRIQRGIPISICFGSDDQWTQDMEYRNGDRLNVVTVGMIIDSMYSSCGIEDIPNLIVFEICRFLENESDDENENEDDPVIDRTVTNAMHFVREQFEALNRGKRQIIFEALDATKEQSVQKALWNVQHRLSRNEQSVTLDSDEQKY